jgi:hypothetical protein
MTISFNMLGHHGRLGNQMFQYATLKSIATKHEYDFTIPPSDFIDPWHDHQLFEGFELSSLSKENIRFNQTQQKVEEGQFHFNQELYDNCPDNVDLFGYFQTEKYFEHISDEIRKDFIFKEEIFSIAKEYRNSIVNDEIVSLHIRRGDYVNQPWHGCCTLEYYEKSLSMLDGNLPVIIFTDDPKWVLKQNIFDSDRFYVSEGNSNLFDMCLMSLCNYHIIANSSFSWWGAWLSDSKKVIAPQRWFGPPLSEQNDIQDLIPNRWVKI